MSRNAVHAGHRRRTLFAVNHTAGDLVYADGFYGTVEDDVDVSKDAYGTLILNGVYKFSNVPSTQASGVVMAAPATEMATSLKILPHGYGAAASGVVPGEATVGWHPIGKSWATGNATLAPIQLFNPNPF